MELNERTNEIARTYLEGFYDMDVATISALKKRRHAEEEEKTDGLSNKKSRPNFLPHDLCAPLEGDDVKNAKKKMIDSYLETCSNYLDAVEALGKVDTCAENETKGALEERIKQNTMQPTETSFWRDGEEVIMNNGEDGYSNDFKVNNTLSSILLTLQRFSACSKQVQRSKNVKDALKQLEHNMKMLEVIEVKQRYCKIISSVKSLLLAFDTSQGMRKCLINQLNPSSCIVSKQELNRLCAFNGFGDVNNGWMECRFFIPIKLLFLGNSKTRQFGDSGTSFTVELSSDFGMDFYNCLETIYDVGFEMLEKKVQQHKRNGQLKTEQYQQAIKELNQGDLSSLVLIEEARKRDNNITVSNDMFLSRLPPLVRSYNIRILGTSGSQKSDTRLSYVCFDKITNTLVQMAPQDHVDALFVSSYIRFKMSENGSVFMDIFTRTALRLETDEDDNEEKINDTV